MTSKSLQAELDEIEHARQWFAQLRTEQKWELGDVLVLGDFDWRDWLPSAPSPLFMRVVDNERITWEILGD